MASKRYKLCQFHDGSYGVEVFERRRFRWTSVGFLDMADESYFVWGNFIKNGKYCKAEYDIAFAKYNNAVNPVAKYPPRYGIK